MENIQKKYLKHFCKMKFLYLKIKYMSCMYIFARKAIHHYDYCFFLEKVIVYLRKNNMNTKDISTKKQNAYREFNDKMKKKI